MILHHLTNQRRGVVLMVVLAMLTLFAAVGLAFVSYTESEATQAQNQKLSEVVKLPDADNVFDYILRQMVYDTNDLGSALRGNSLLVNTYGTNGRFPQSGIGRKFFVDPTTGLPLMGTPPPAGSRLSGIDPYYQINFQGASSVPDSLNPSYNYPDANTPFMGAMTKDGNIIARSFVRDVKLRLPLEVIGTPPDYWDEIFNPFDQSLFFYLWGKLWPENPTLPNPYILIPEPTLGTTCVYLPLPNPGDPGGPPLGRTYRTQTSATPYLKVKVVFGKAYYLLDRGEFTAITLRPNPLNSPNFPAPSSGGDVKQLPPDTRSLVGWIPGATPTPILANNESYWLDFGFPAFTNPATNKKIKTLAAIFALDMDGKLNVNAHGNTRGIYPNSVTSQIAMQHVSNMTSQPSDVNLSKVIKLNDPSAIPPMPEWPILYSGRSRIANYIDERGKYGRQTAIAYGGAVTGQVNDGEPNALNANLGTLGNVPPQTNYDPILRVGPYYSAIDGDGTRSVYGGNPPDLNNVLYYPATPFTGPRKNNLDRFPIYSNLNPGFGDPFVDGYNNFTPGYEFYHRINGNSLPRNPLFGTNFGPGFPLGYQTDFNRNFSAANIETLYRLGDTNSDALNSELRILIPNNFADPTIRRQLTTHSFTLNRPALAPWRQATSDKLAYNDVLANRYRFVSGNPIAYPGKPGAAPGGEFATYLDASSTLQFTEKSILTALSQVDLNRPLPDYPQPPSDATGTQPYDFTYAFPAPAGGAQQSAVNAKALQQAIKSRQDFATDIYLRLVYATGAFDPFDTTAAPTPQQINALRWLAQLSVNIVDYIDSDDYVTCFNWGRIGSPAFTGTLGGEFVYGTELPRLVLNEAYAEARNAPKDPLPGGNASLDYTVYNWLELYNPFSTSTFGAWPDNAATRLKFPSQAWSIYQVYVYKNLDISTIRDPNNTTGTGNTGTTPKIVNLGNTIQFVDPSDYWYSTSQVMPAPQPGHVGGFLMLGPTTPFPSDGTVPPAFPAVPVADEQDVNMQVDGRLSHTVPFDNAAQNNSANQQAYVLKRLACPYMEPDSNPLVIALLPKYQAMGLAIGDPNPFYNPYITVDYQSNVVINRAIDHNSSGKSESDSYTSRFSYGRMQPYAGNASFLLQQTPDLNSTTPGAIDPYTNQPQHTFKRHNAIEEPRALPPGGGVPNGYDVNLSTGQWNPAPSTLPETIRKPLDWLTHLDRPLVSPGELLHVSSYKPHELTQQFNMAVMDPTLINGGAPDATVKTTAPIAGGSTATIQLPPGSYIGYLGAPNYNPPNDFIYGVQGSHTWRLQAGDLVVVDTGTNTEVVSVNPLSLTPGGSFQAFFTKPHAAGVDVSLLIRHGHTAPWKAADTRLHRAFEFLATRSAGVDLGQVRLQATSVSDPFRADPTTTDPDTGTLLPQELYGTRLVKGVTLLKVDPNNNFNVVAACNLANLPTNANLVGIPMNDAIIDLHDGDTLVIPDPVFTAPGSRNGERIKVVRVDKPRNRFFATFQANPLPVPIPLNIDLTFQGGRTPKVNLNTLWDEDSFQGVADAEPANGFYPTVTTDPIHNSIFKRLTTSRRPVITNTVGGYTDRPFLGFGQITSTAPAQSNLAASGGVLGGDVQAFPNQKGIEDTWLRSNPLFNNPTTIEDTGGLGLFDYGNLGLDHPYRVNELLTKMWNNISSRSNVFAVWITIGFFEYDDVTGIGQELSQLDGRNTRYRFFAVIDRSQLESWVNSSSGNYDVALGVPSAITGYSLLNQNGTPIAGDGTLGLLASTKIDPRYDSYLLPPAIGNAKTLVSPGVFQVVPTYDGVTPNTRYFTPGQLILINPGQGQANGEQIAEVLNPFLASGGAQTDTNNSIYLRLSGLSPPATIMLQPLPVPRTVLYWSQIK